jgi:hypothetical protein
MGKKKRNYKVVSCSGITDSDLPAPRCPFFCEDIEIWDICALLDCEIRYKVVPEDCPLRKFHIEVESIELE